jgi:hypothetical protein
VFGGWDFVADDAVRPDFITQGYRRGVPMGGDLRDAPGAKSPTFLIRALRDPDGANLDRVQVIKGWLDSFYYVRVLEIPTPRWTTYDAAFFGIDLPDNVPPTIQDRAYTSPIWYTP